MKRMLTFLIVVLAINISKAQIPLEINQDGKYRAKKDLTWRDTDILTDANALKYVDRFPEAIANPGKIILVDKKESVKLKLFFKKKIKIYKEEVVYNDLRKEIFLIKSTEEKTEKSHIILFGIFSVFFMIISNFFYRRKDSRYYVFLLFSTALALFFSISLFFAGLFSTLSLLSGLLAVMMLYYIKNDVVYTVGLIFYYSTIIFNILIIYSRTL